MLPFQLPTKSIKQVISKSAEWFYKKYEDSVEERLFHMEQPLFETERFLSTKIIVVPECVYSIYGVYKMRASSSNAIGGHGAHPDFSVRKSLSQSYYTQTGSQSDDLLYYTAFAALSSMTHEILDYPVTYNYNRNSKKLVILGEVPKFGLALQCQVKLPLGYLMKDEIFFRYCVAYVKMQLARILGTFQMPLAGEAELNYELYREEGREEMEKIQEEIRQDEGMDFFFMSNGG